MDDPYISDEMMERAESVSKENTSAQSGMYYGGLQDELLTMNTDRYVDPLILKKATNIQNAYYREEVAAKDAIAYRLTWDFQKRAFAEAIKICLSDEIGAPEIMPEIGVYLQQYKDKLIYLAVLKQIHGWVVAKNWVMNGQFKSYMFSENECNYSCFIRDPADPLGVSVLGFQLNKLKRLPLDRPVMWQQMVLPKVMVIDPGVLYSVRGDKESSNGYGWSIFESCWDQITKLRQMSHNNAFRDALFPIARVPQKWSNEQVLKFTDKISKIDQTSLLVMKSPNDNLGNPIPDMPSFAFSSLADNAKSPIPQGGSAEVNNLGTEWVRLCAATHHTFAYFTGSGVISSSLAAGQVDSDFDIQSDIDEFNITDRPLILEFLACLARLGIIPPLPPNVVIKSAWQYKREEALIQNQMLLMQQAAGQTQGQPKQNEVARLNRPGPKSKKEKAAEDRFVGLRHAAGQKSAIGKKAGMIESPQESLAPIDESPHPLANPTAQTSQAMIPSPDHAPMLPESSTASSINNPSTPSQAAPPQGGINPNTVMNVPSSIGAAGGPNQVAYGDEGLVLQFPGKDPYFYPTQEGLADAPIPVVGQDPITPENAQQAAMAAMSGDKHQLHEILKGDIPGQDFARQPAPGNEYKKFAHVGFSHKTRYTVLAHDEDPQTATSNPESGNPPPKGSWASVAADPGTEETPQPEQTTFSTMPGNGPIPEPTTAQASDQTESDAKVTHVYHHADPNKPPKTGYKQPAPGSAAKVAAAPFTDYNNVAAPTTPDRPATRLGPAQTEAEGKQGPSKRIATFKQQYHKIAQTAAKSLPYHLTGAHLAVKVGTGLLGKLTNFNNQVFGRQMRTNEAYDPTAELPDLLIGKNQAILSITQAAKTLHKSKETIYKLLEDPIQGFRCNMSYTGNSFNTHNPFIYNIHGQASIEYQCPDHIKQLIGIEVPVIVGHENADAHTFDPVSSDRIIGKYRITGFDEEKGIENGQYDIDESAARAYLKDHPDASWAIDEDGKLRPEIETSTGYKCNIHYDRSKRRKIQTDFKMKHLAIVKHGNCSRGLCDLKPSA